ncbi:MAG TPA: glutamate--cysteine ligase, partial [Bacteroidales bacterium]|nr:glutamate--cysteine ligase [Bacteroidales bacterium]
MNFKKLDIQDLSNWFRSGIKSESEWGIGTEHEQFLYNKKDLKRLAYNTHPGIRQVLQELQKDIWKPVFEGENLIALSAKGVTITLEPGGQLELSGGNFATVHETYTETMHHLEVLSELGERLGFYNLPIGFEPFWKREDIPWMPKERYKYMKSWMPTKGRLGLDMMTRTSSIQVNLDFSSEQDMIKKAQVAQAFQSVVMALFANSPFTEKKPNGYISYRSKVWDDTDNDRCGFLPFIFDKNFGFDSWTEYLLDVPMYFIFRDEKYYPANGMTFREFMKKSKPFEPTIEDWEVHVTTVFPDIRLKKFLELRGADAGGLGQIAALAAFWVG